MRTKKQTGIQWADYTFNPYRGCTQVSEGCKFCYAEGTSLRNPHTLGVWGKKGRRAPASEQYWKFPYAWDAEAKAAGKPLLVFCASLADVFEGADTCPSEDWHVVEEARQRLWKTIEETPNLIWLLLTKRPQNIPTFYPMEWLLSPPANVWLGTTVENQRRAGTRISDLLYVPCALHFLSLEPLLEWVNLHSVDWGDGVTYNVYGNYFMREKAIIHSNLQRVGWIITGGESGTASQNVRPLAPQWIYEIAKNAAKAEIPFLHKQNGEYILSDEVDGIGGVELLPSHTFTGGTKVIRVGKHSAGNRVFGETYMQFPKQARR
jgi:protein gp37